VGALQARPPRRRPVPSVREVILLRRRNRKGNRPAGAVPLSAAIASLREELTRAWWDAQHRSVRFKPSPVELTLQVAVTSESQGTAGVRWWLIELGGEMSRQSAVTQTVKMTLEPRMFDESTGKPLEFLIDAAEEPVSAQSRVWESPLEG
jgi:hypothetical protein